MNRESKARLTAKLIVDSAWTAPAFFQVLQECRLRKSDSIESLVQKLVTQFPKPVSLNRLAEFLLHNARGELAKLSPRRLQKSVPSLATVRSEMRTPIQAATEWLIPAIISVSELASLLRISVQRLDWLAADYGDHYLVRGIRKKSGGVRVVESPKKLLKQTQRSILWEILNWIPAHQAAHGFVQTRSALSYVQPHVNRPFLMRMDLQDFFPSIDVNRVWGLFRSLGYPNAVVQLLTDLCTCCPNSTQLLEATDGRANRDQQPQLMSLYHRRHLPQGAPTSPALANLIAYRLDCRLSGLASFAGAAYTRYADDLLFSGDLQFARSAKSFATQVGAIVLEEGFQLNYRKTRMMRQSTRQSAAGIVINQTTNLRRSDYDTLKAILHNCVRHGFSSQNRAGHLHFREHLLGRINWLRQLNPHRAEKLMRILNQIDWS